MIRKAFVIICIILFAVAPGQAQGTAKARKRLTFRQKAHIADSVRNEIRRAADDGRLLQWGDSILRSQLDKGEIDKRKYAKLRHRLYHYDHTLHRGDSLLAARYNRVTFDTAYIRRPSERWTIKFRGNVSSSKINADGKRDGVPFGGEVTSDYRGTMSVAATYRGISLGLAVNPAKIAGKNKDNEFNINSYGNKFGFDVNYLTSETYKGTISSGEATTEIGKGMVSQKALNANAYYAFNGRRFSMPAAFSQSYIQRRSAGSVMMGVSFDGQSTRIAANDFSTVPIKLKVVEFGIGAGYGYNLVASRHWLFHLSALPTFNVFIKSRVSVGDETIKMHYKFPSVIITGRYATVYSWKNKFAGASMLFNFSDLGDDNRLLVRRTKWRFRMFYGFRF